MSSEEIFSREGSVEKLPSSASASSELEGIVEQLDYLQDISRQIANEFADVSSVGIWVLATLCGNRCIGA